MPESDCLFCKMASGAIPVEKLHNDSFLFAIRDINPRAPAHILVIPNRHIASAHDVGIDDGLLLGHMYEVANSLMDELGHAEGGYRLAVNVGPDGGQTIYHLHMHVLAGRPLGAEG